MHFFGGASRNANLRVSNDPNTRKVPTKHDLHLEDLAFRNMSK